MKHNLNLLPKALLFKTNTVDHADWNYKPFLRFIQRKRFQLALELMDINKYDKILEIGYGSGVFMPILSKHCNQLFGIDLHPFNKKVTDILEQDGIMATLEEGSVSKMPYADESFDLVVSISAFEFVDDKRNACKEIFRVLKKEGVFIMVTPGNFKILDFGLKILTRASAKEDYGDKRQQVMLFIEEYFSVTKRKVFPSFLLRSGFAVYKAYILSPIDKG
jgi:ubiquinone/menaquinone biosynthesis C-methylase UbiE